MRVSRALAVIVVAVMFALAYVHQQVELLKLSYQIGCKEKRMSVLLDHREKLIYNLTNLTSPSHLERMLVSKNVAVEYPRKEQVIRVAVRGGIGSDRSLRFAAASRGGVMNTLLDLIGMGPEAQAKER